MTGYLGQAPTPPRVAELWSAVVARLDSPGMHTILGGAGRVFMIDADGASDPAGGEDEAWGRGVVAPVRRAFGEPESNPGRDRLVSFLVRFDIHDPGGGFDPLIPLEAAHEEAFEQLHGWTPTGFAGATIDRPVWRHTDPQSHPLWDDRTGVWFTSAEYRVWLSPA